MLQIHRSGQGIAGIYVLEVAETKVAAVHRVAEENGFPLHIIFCCYNDEDHALYVKTLASMR